MKRYLLLVLISLVGMSGCVAMKTITLPDVHPRDPVSELRGYLAKPEGKGPFPAAVILHTCSGVNDHVMQEWPNFFVDQGYVALTVDTLGSRDVPTICGGANSSRRPTPERRVADAYGALDYLVRQPFVDPQRVALIGFSWGGGTVLYATSSYLQSQFRKGGDTLFRAGVAVYPNCGGQAYGQVSFGTPTLVIGAELDDWTPVAECSGIRMQEGSKPFSVQVMPGAHHAFDQFTHNGRTMSARTRHGHTLAPDWQATKRARKLTIEFFHEHFREPK